MKATSSARRFAVENLVPVVIGAVIAVVIYKAVLPVLPEDSSVRIRLTERGFIPALCMWLLWWQLSYLVLHYFLRIRPDTELLAADIIPEGENPLTQEDIDAMAGRLAELGSSSGSSRLARRILLSLNLQKQGAGLSDARHVQMKHAEAERARVESAYAAPKLLIWAIPILGFIGTVLGIGLAVGNLKQALALDVEAQAGEAQITEALARVAANLGVAFDTTHVALWMCILGMITMTVVKRIESRILADVEDYVSLRLLTRLRFQSPVEKLSNEVRTLCSRLDEMLRRTR